MYLIDTNDLGFAQGVPTQIKNTTGFPDGPEELDDHIGDQKKNQQCNSMQMQYTLVTASVSNPIFPRVNSKRSW